MSSPELAQLRAFAAVAELRSYRRAAVQLNVSPSAVSQAVRALEQHLGVSLLNRTTRSVATNEAGAQLYERLREHLGGLASALQEASGLGDQVSGRLKINMPRSAAGILVKPLIAPFLRAHPKVQLEIVTQDSFADIVATGCDAGIRFSESVPLDMVALPIGPIQRFVVAATPAVMEQHGVPEDPWALLSRPCVRFRFPSGALYRWEFERGEQRFTLDVQGPLTLDDQRMIVRATLDGVGFGYLYEAMAQPYIASGELVTALEDWWPVGTGFQLYYPSRRQTSPALRAFIAWLQAGGAVGA